MPGLTDWFDVFRCGTHTDRFGREVTISQSDIDRAISSYEKDSAPIVVGHPALNAPAFGWIGAFRRVGDVVQAKASSVADEFADLVHKHMYKNRSLAFGPGLRFRHVGFLGAQPPAVKGLRDIQFSDEEEFMDVEFSEPTNTPAAAEAEVPASPAAGTDMPAPGSEPAAEAAQPSEAEKAEAETPKKDGDAALLDELAKLKEQMKAAEEAAKQHKEVIAQLQEQCRAAGRDLRKAEFAAFADDLIAGGRLHKDQRGRLLEFMECLHGLDSYEFSEGSEPVLQRFKDLFRAVSKRPVQFAEFASAEAAAVPQSVSPAELAAKAREYIDAEAQKGRKVSATQAVEHVQKG